MHRHGQRHEVGRAHALLVERLDGEVDRVHAVAARAQRGGGRGEAERLVALLVGREQQDAGARGGGAVRGRRSGGVVPRERRGRLGAGHYFFEGWKYGFAPEAWSVASATASISGTASLIATSMPCLSVTSARPQPWQPPPRRM